MRTPRLIKFLQSIYFIGPLYNDYRPSLMIYGPPGIGKSEAIYIAAKKIAEKLGKQFVYYTDDVAHELINNPGRYFVFVDLRLTELEPSDLIGIPRDVNDAIAYKPLLWARTLNKCPGILFLDEITNVTRPDIKAISYKILLDRMAGFVRFNKDVLIVAAGNKAEHSAIVEGFTLPQANRLIIIDLKPPTIDEWASYMNSKYGDEWDKTAYAFLKAFENENYILQLPKEPLIEYNFPSHRSWSILARLLYFMEIDPTCLLGVDVGSKFKAFRKIHVDVKDLIRTPTKFRELDIEGKYMACLMIAEYIRKNGKDISRVLPVIDVIANESREYLVFTCKMMSRDALEKFIDELQKYNIKYIEMLLEVIEWMGKIRG